MSSGILAPKGWYCFGVYGSSGSTLFVTPQPLKNDDIFSSTWHGIAGPAIEVQDEDGDTTGRGTVGRVIARVFPKQKAFVQGIIDMDLGRESDFPFGPYPNDKLTYHGDRVVEFQTPRHSEGLGTMSELRTSGNPIDGVAILKGDKFDLLLLSVRLPSKTRGLTSHIIRQVERDYATLTIP